MDKKSRLCIVRDASGDIHVLVLQYGQTRVSSVAEVEFCTIETGGQSPKTFDVLLHLIGAIEEDNKRGKNSKHVVGFSSESE